MEKRQRYIASLMLAVFAFFYCGNTLFIHTHTGKEGNLIVHSHPYFPNSQHSHSNNSLSLIALWNAAISSAQRSSEVFLPRMAAVTVLVRTAPRPVIVINGVRYCASGLDPPMPVCA